jgi:hypothetical protein
VRTINRVPPYYSTPIRTSNSRHRLHNDRIQHHSTRAHIEDSPRRVTKSSNCKVAPNTQTKHGVCALASPRNISSTPNAVVTNLSITCWRRSISESSACSPICDTCGPYHQLRSFLLLIIPPISTRSTPRRESGLNYGHLQHRYLPEWRHVSGVDVSRVRLHRLRGSTYRRRTAL